eukprot:9384666-Pyramimonas_sp.AAC.1
MLAETSGQSAAAFGRRSRISCAVLKKTDRADDPSLRNWSASVFATAVDKRSWSAVRPSTSATIFSAVAAS